MIICDICKQDPVATAPNEALKAGPWGIVLSAPSGSGLPEKRMCWACTLRMFDRWVTLAEANPPKKKTN